MKIAVPTKENNEIDAHFGHCEFYTIYTVSDQNELISKEKMESPQGCGCKSNIAEVFENDGVKIMLAGGIGDGAINKLSMHGVSVIRNCKGNVTEIVRQYLAGNLKDGGSSCASHAHGHEEGHVCSHN
ncbi:MAG: NifB/NifX family molybdenum-iron cluster-binding protein [Paludibacter sp.]|jgi:predicted Fe-Mo cluster-binding NifX family protein|nr:NifB/NifX family molybdenum-iron cluster-binding protein [Paludibacter sp.]